MGIARARALDGRRPPRRSASRAPRPPTAGAADEVAVAFSINGDVDTPDGRETIRLLARAFEEEPPDLILIETLSLVRTSTYATVEALLDTGLPVWLSFRRCRHGVCGVYGEHWGGPEGDAFGRAARRFEEMGVGALAINCVPPGSRPRDAVVAARLHRSAARRLPEPRLPLVGGVARRDRASAAPNTPSWRCSGATRAPRSSAAAAASGPEHLAATRAALDGTKPGHVRVPRRCPDE